MSQRKKKQVGKQIARKRYRKLRYDLVILGMILVIAGVLAYNIIMAAQPSLSSTGVKREDPLEVLRVFSGDYTRNGSIILVYKVRGDLPAGSFILGTLDYTYVYIRKEITVTNESSKTTFTAFIYASQGPLYVIAEVLGLAFRSENLSDLFFNPQIRTTWINSTIEGLGEEVVSLKLLGEVRTVSQVYRYYKVIDGKTRYVEVTALRLVDFSYIPARVEILIDSNKFSLELVELRKVS